MNESLIDLNAARTAIDELRMKNQQLDVSMDERPAECGKEVQNVVGCPTLSVCLFVCSFLPLSYGRHHNQNHYRRHRTAFCLHNMNTVLFSQNIQINMATININLGSLHWVQREVGKQSKRFMRTMSAGLGLSRKLDFEGLVVVASLTHHFSLGLSVKQHLYASSPE